MRAKPAKLKIKAGKAMKLNKKLCQWTAGWMMTSFVWTGLALPSMPTVFAATSPTASPASTADQVQQPDLSKGLLALGLLALLTRHDSSSAPASPKQASTPTQTTTKPTGTTNSTTPTNSTTSNNTSTSNSNTSSSGATAFTLAAEEKEAVNLLNADRAAQGLKPLTVDSSLTRLAENYAQDMINRNFFDHYNPEGQSPFDRMRQAGISYLSAGENIAINTSVSKAEVAFMNSSGHRANILNTSYTHVGIGVRHSANGSVYVVQEFVGR